MSDKYNNNCCEQLKTYPAQPLSENYIFSIDRCGKKSFQYQHLPEVKKKKSHAEYSRTQQRKSHHARQDKIDHGILTAWYRRLFVDHERRKSSALSVLFHPLDTFCKKRTKYGIFCSARIRSKWRNMILPISPRRFY